MRSEEIQHRRYQGAILWAPVIFLLVFLAILSVIAYFLTEPMLRAASISPQNGRKIAAYATLIVVLLISSMLVGLFFTIIATRRRSLKVEKPKPTRYPDVWQESARRVHTPTAEELEAEAGADPGDDEPESRG